MPTCSKCIDGFLVPEDNVLKCVNCGNRHPFTSQLLKLTNIPKTPKPKPKPFDSPSTLQKAMDWVEGSHESFGIPPVHSAYTMLEQLGEPFMREYARFADGEMVLVRKAPFFEWDPEYQRQRQKAVPNGSPAMWKAWQQGWKQIDEQLLQLSAPQRDAVRKLLRLRSEQHRLYIQRIAHQIGTFRRIFKEERVRNSNLKAVLCEHSLFDNESTNDLIRHCKFVDEHLSHSESIVHEVERLLVKAMGITPKKSKLREAQKNLRYLWPKALK
jgi:hypothetical protein